VKEDLTQLLFDFIPVGVGSKGILPTDAKQVKTSFCCCCCFSATTNQLSDVLEMGMDWSVRQVGEGQGRVLCSCNGSLKRDMLGWRTRNS
jgi:hypothetical protein